MCVSFESQNDCNQPIYFVLFLMLWIFVVVKQHRGTKSKTQKDIKREHLSPASFILLFLQESHLFMGSQSGICHKSNTKLHRCTGNKKSQKNWP